MKIDTSLRVSTKHCDLWLIVEMFSTSLYSRPTDTYKAHLHLLKPRFLNSRFFVSPFALAQKTANLAQVRNFAVFWIGTAHARKFHIFPSIESAYNCVCVCVCVCVRVMCVCVMYMCVLAYVCVRACVYVCV